MKLLAFTDTHDDPDMLPRIGRLIMQERPDLLVCAGDFTIFGSDMEPILQQIAGFGPPVVLIHGNHEDPAEVARHVERFENMHFVHGKVLTVNGQRFFGWGGHGFRQHEPELEQLERELGDQIDGSTIVISHAPPYGTALDEVDPGWHVGCETLTHLIKKRRPMLVFAGHIHECFHTRDSLGGALLINPGPDGEIIEVEE